MESRRAPSQAGKLREREATWLRSESGGYLRLALSGLIGPVYLSRFPSPDAYGNSAADSTPKPCFTVLVESVAV